MTSVRLPRWLFSRAASLSELGLNELAWQPDDALLVVGLLSESDVAVLGGDVYAKRAGKFEPLYENWYVDKNAAELPSGFAWGANTSVAEQAEWLRDAIEIAATTANVDLIIVFDVNFTRFIDGDPQGGFAIIRPDGSCPACDAIAQLRGAG